MATEREEIDKLRAELDALRKRLDEPEEIIRAIRQGEVDSFVVTAPSGEQIYSLRSADALYRSMVEEMSEGAVALEATGLILYSNSYFATMMKATRGSLLGRSIFPFVPEEARSFFEALRTNGTATNASRKELALRATDGELIPAHITMNPISVEGGDRVFCLIVTDLTLERRREELVAESRRKDEFLAMLAHELRNPMASIRSAIDALQLGGLAEEKVTWTLSMISRQVTQLNRLIDDLLDVSRITRGQIRLEMRPLDLATVVQRAIETATPEIAARKHELTIGLPGARVRVLGDDARLSQVVSNLLHNAAKFTPDGGHISVKLLQNDGEARICVKDDGVGIEPEMFSKIFDVFAQVDTSLERTRGGLGIGLSLVRNLVEMHRGRVSVHSEGKDKGSEFVVTLPILREAEKPEGRARKPAEGSTTGSSRRVLVVDDNVDAGESLLMLLTRLGHEAQLVTEGKKALAATRELRPDVVLLDIGLPDVSGYEVAKELATLPERGTFKLIALTGYGQDQDRQRSKDVGFDLHWVKPLDLNVLKSFLAALPGADAQTSP